MKLSVFSETEYYDALELMEKIGDDPNFEHDEKLMKEFNLLLKFVKEYESQCFYINVGNPIEIIKLKMNYLGLKAKDLIPYVGSKGIVSEVLNKKRALSKAMIRNLSEFLSIDQELLNIEYSLDIDKIEKYNKSTVLKKNIAEGVQEFAQRVRGRGLLFNICSVR